MAVFPNRSITLVIGDQQNDVRSRAGEFGLGGESDREDEDEEKGEFFHFDQSGLESRINRVCMIESITQA